MSLITTMGWKPEGYISDKFVSNEYQISLLARCLAFYDEATWMRLKPRRRATYVRAAETLLHQGNIILTELNSVRQGREYRTKNEQADGKL